MLLVDFGGRMDQEGSCRGHRYGLGWRFLTVGCSSAGRLCSSRQLACKGHGKEDVAARCHTQRILQQHLDAKWTLKQNHS